MEKDYIQLVISINLLHFHPAFIPENFGHISTAPFHLSAGTGTATATANAEANATQPNLVPGTPQQQQLHRALKEVVNSLSPGTLDNTSFDDLGLLSQRKSQHFKPDALPDNVKERYLKRKAKDKLFTSTERKPFQTETPNTTINPSGIIVKSTFYYQDGPHRLITRSGDVFYFSRYDAKETKNFIA